MNLDRRLFYLFIITSLAFAACAPVAMVKPLAAKQKAVTASLGGPLIGFSNAVIPVPFTSVGFAYGLNDKSTLSTRVHTTSALFGVAHLETGYLRQLRAAKGNVPGISVNGQASWMFDGWAHRFRAYPQLDLNAWWDVGTQGSYWYVGGTTWFEPLSKGTGERAQSPRFIPAAHVGFSRERTKWSTRVEMKYLAPFNSHQSLTVDYKAPGNNGAIGIYLSLMRKF